jgi:hypothetical protein
MTKEDLQATVQLNIWAVYMLDYAGNQKKDLISGCLLLVIHNNDLLMLAKLTKD